MLAGCELYHAFDNRSRVRIIAQLKVRGCILFDGFKEQVQTSIVNVDPETHSGVIHNILQSVPRQLIQLRRMRGLGNLNTVQYVPGHRGNVSDCGSPWGADGQMVERIEVDQTVA